MTRSVGGGRGATRADVCIIGSVSRAPQARAWRRRFRRLGTQVFLIPGLPAAPAQLRDPARSRFLREGGGRICQASGLAQSFSGPHVTLSASQPLLSLLLCWDRGCSPPCTQSHAAHTVSSDGNPFALLEKKKKWGVSGYFLLFSLKIPLK